MKKGLEKEWFKEEEIKIVKKVCIYQGPDLPFIQDRVLYFYYYKHEKEDFDLDDAAETALVKLNHGVTNIGWKWLDQRKIYFSLNPHDYVYLVQVKLLYHTGKLRCCICGMRPFKRDYAKAYYGVPLNKEAWEDWICPDCI